MVDVQIDGQMDGQIEKWVDRWVGRCGQMDRQVDGRQMCCWLGREMGKWIYVRQVDKWQMEQQVVDMWVDSYVYV